MALDVLSWESVVNGLLGLSTITVSSAGTFRQVIETDISTTRRQYSVENMARGSDMDMFFIVLLIMTPSWVDLQEKIKHR
jgi:hypothetical protein